MLTSMTSAEFAGPRFFAVATKAGVLLWMTPLCADARAVVDNNTENAIASVQ